MCIKNDLTHPLIDRQASPEHMGGSCDQSRGSSYIWEDSSNVFLEPTQNAQAGYDFASPRSIVVKYCWGGRGPEGGDNHHN